MHKSIATPLVSVIMPVYNADRFLRQAVDSILQQTFTNFELIAIDDGSTDGSGAILDEYASRDTRIVVIHQKNAGIVEALNNGLRLAKGQYIARQDSDDISFQQRLAQQSKVLEEHPEIVLVTGGFEVFDEEGEFLYREVIPADDSEIKRAMLLRNPIGHGSVMFRKEACEKVGLYSDEYGPTEDFLLWTKLAQLGEFYGVEPAVFRWRVNKNGITSTKNHFQLEAMKVQVNKLWEVSPPRHRTAAELRSRGAHYVKTYQKRGVDMKNIMLADTSQLAVKLVRRGRYLQGLRQLVAVALVGRSGLRAVHHRFRSIQHGTIAAVRRRTRFGRQTPA